MLINTGSGNVATFRATRLTREREDYSVAAQWAKSRPNQGTGVSPLRARLATLYGMAGPSSTGWSYSDWNDQSLFPDATTARLKRLDLHIKEVADAISCGGYQIRGRYVNIQDL